MDGCRGMPEDDAPVLSVPPLPPDRGIPMSYDGKRSDPQFFSCCDPDKMSVACRAWVEDFIHPKVRIAVVAMGASVDMVHCQPGILQDGIPYTLLPGEIKSFHLHRTQQTDVEFDIFHFSSTGLCDFAVDDVDDVHDDGKLMHGQSFLCMARFADSLYAAKITPASRTAVSVAWIGSEK